MQHHRPHGAWDLVSGLPHLTDDYWHDSLEKAIDAEAPQCLCL